MMIRTQISLSKIDYMQAKKEAGRLGVSLAELLRQSLRAIFPRDTSKPWMKYCGFIESGDKNSSTHLDQIVYGKKD